jgi:hypothetical protein
MPRRRRGGLTPPARRCVRSLPWGAPRRSALRTGDRRVPSAVMSLLTLPRSVTSAFGRRWGAACAISTGMSGAGVAKTTRSASCTPVDRSVVPLSIAPTLRADVSASASVSIPMTLSTRPRCRSAIPSEPPIRPIPTIATRSKRDNLLLPIQLSHCCVTHCSTGGQRGTSLYPIGTVKPQQAGLQSDGLHTRIRNEHCHEAGTGVRREEPLPLWNVEPGGNYAASSGYCRWKGVCSARV